MDRFITVERTPSQLNGYPPGSFLPHELAWPPVGTGITGEHADDRAAGRWQVDAGGAAALDPPATRGGRTARSRRRRARASVVKSN